MTITVSARILLILSVCLVVFLSFNFCRKGGKESLGLALNFLFVLAVVFLVFLLEEIFVNVRLNSFDVNGDGMFDGSESSKDQQYYFSLVIGDSGKVFLLSQAVIAAGISTMFLFVVNRIRR